MLLLYGLKDGNKSLCSISHPFPHTTFQSLEQDVMQWTLEPPTTCSFLQIATIITAELNQQAATRIDKHQVKVGRGAIFKASRHLF